MLNNTGFDLWADGYDRDVVLSDEENTYPFAGYKDVLGRVFQAVMRKTGASVLDLGFGTGVLTAKLYEHGCTVFGQDFSERMLALASAKMPDARLYCGDLTEGLVGPLQDRTYDFIISTYALHHLDDAQKVRFLHDLLTRLSPNGAILIGDVAFQTRAELERCRLAAGDAWDDDEFYCVFDELKDALPGLRFEKISFCAGILSLERTGE